MKIVRVVLAGALVLGMITATSAVSAKEGDVRRTGSCSNNSAWKLKLSPEDGGQIEVEYQVDSNVVGQEWRVVLRNDGIRFFKGVRTTKGPSGSFTVHKLTNDGAGSDRIVGRARNLETDEVCSGAATI